MVIPASVLLQFLGIFIGVKVMDINLKILGIILATLVPIAVTSVVPGLAGLVIGMVIFYVVIKACDNSVGIFQIIGLLIISAVVQALMINEVVAPMLNQQVNDLLK